MERECALPERSEGIAIEGAAGDGMDVFMMCWADSCLSASAKPHFPL